MRIGILSAFSLLLPLAQLPAQAHLAQRTPDEAQQALVAGNQRFCKDRSVPQPLGEGTRRTLAHGQNPLAVILTCADSRVAPEHLFNAGLGELIVVRTPGHVVDSEALATLEHAVETYDVPLCVVLGHEQCATVAQALAIAQADHAGSPQPALTQLQRALFEHLEPAVRKVAARDLGGADLFAAGEEEHAQATALECLRRSPLLRRYHKAGRFRITAARYHLQSGQVEWLPQRPLPLDDAVAAAVRSVAPLSIPPHVALRMLQAGNRRFLGDGPPSADLSASRREQLTHGQQPFAIVLCCADSRVVPEHLFDAGLGELVVLRSAGAVLTDVVLAGIEKAVAETGASLVLVLGHSRCDAFALAKDGADRHGAGLTSHQRLLQQRLEPALLEAGAAGGSPAEIQDRAAAAFAARTVAALRARSALLAGLEQAGKLAVLPALYDVASGDLRWLKDGVPEAAAAPAGEVAGPTPGARGAAANAGAAPAERERPAGRGAQPSDSEAAATHGGHGAPTPPKSGAHGTTLGNPFDALLLDADHDQAHSGGPEGQPERRHGKQAGATSSGAHGAGHGTGHTAPTQDHDGRGAAGHGGPGHGAEATAPAGGGDAAHGGAAQHGAPRPAGEHGAADSGHAADAGHGAADGHGAAATGSGAKGKGFDPIVVTGLVGIASLLIAASMVAFGKR